MYIRVKKFQRIDGVKTYYYVVEGVRKEHTTKQRVIKYLGSIESIMSKIELAEQVMKNNEVTYRNRTRYFRLFRG